MKQSILILLLVIISLSGWSQVTDSITVQATPVSSLEQKPEKPARKGKTTLGLRGGVNYTYIKDMRTNGGFLAGAFARFHGNKGYFEPSINVSNLKIYNTQLHTNSIVLDINLLGGYDFIRSKNFDARVFAGPIISVPLDKKSNKNLSVSDNDDDDDDDETTGWDMVQLMAKLINGVKAGAGVTICKAVTINGEYSRRYNYAVEHSSNVFTVSMEVNLRYRSKSMFKGYR